MCSSSCNLVSPRTQPSLSFTGTHIPKTRISFPTRFRPVKISAAAVQDGPVEDSAASFYDLLGISVDGTLGEIKQAYKQLARKYHPDVSPPGRVEEYTERFIRVQEAYETLSDPRSRALYDRDMARGLHLAFSARRRSNGEEELEDRSAWKNRWQSQLSELRRRSTYKNARGSASWGAKMRRQRDEPLH